MAVSTTDFAKKHCSGGGAVKSCGLSASLKTALPSASRQRLLASGPHIAFGFISPFRILEKSSINALYRTNWYALQDIATYSKAAFPRWVGLTKTKHSIDALTIPATGITI